MLTYEFSTIVTEDGTIVIPADYVGHLPKGEPVHVIVYTEVEKPIDNSQVKTEDSGSLEELVAEIKALPSNPANIRLGNMQQLAACLANPIIAPEPSFDVGTWNREWDRIEAEINASEVADTEGTMKNFLG